MGRITIFTDSICTKSRDTKALLDLHGLPYVEINLSMHPDRRGDMISLVRDVSTPQIFFNAKHVASTCDGLEQILEDWMGDQSLHASVDDGALALALFYSEITADPDPTDHKLRVPPIQTRKGNSFVVQFHPTIIPLPDGTSMRMLALVRHLLKRLPRRTVCGQSGKEFAHAFRGYEAVMVWRQWLHIPAKDATIFGKTLLDHGIIHTLCSNSSEFQEMAFYRLQPLQTPEVLRS